MNCSSCSQKDHKMRNHLRITRAELRCQGHSCVSVASTMVTEQLAYFCIRVSSVRLEVLDVVACWILPAEILAAFHTWCVAVAGDEVVKVVEDFIVFQTRD